MNTYVSTDTTLNFSVFAQNLKSDNTKKAYYRDILAICKFCKKDFLILEKEDIQSYFSMLQIKVNSGDIKTTTINVRYAHLHSFANFLIKKSSIHNLNYDSNPFDLVDIKESNFYLGKGSVPDIEEMNLILKNAEHDLRLYTILTLIIRMALTPGQICKLKIESFIEDPDGNQGIIFLNKNKRRYVKIPADVFSMLDLYISKHNILSGYLFPSRTGTALQPRDLQRMHAAHNPAFTLSQLRNGSIAYMLLCDAPASMIADYIGMQNRSWMSRYDKVIPELHKAAVDYSNIKISAPKLVINETRL